MTPVTAARTITNSHGDTPRASGMVVSPVSHCFMPELTSLSTPVFMAEADSAYMASAIQEPTRPSPERYHVPEAQPPARMMPTPNMNPPTTTASGMNEG